MYCAFSPLNPESFFKEDNDAMRSILFKTIKSTKSEYENNLNFLWNIVAKFQRSAIGTIFSHFRFKTYESP